MKDHIIIPIFIPHLGCGHSCVFCNQNIITARSRVPDISDVKNIIEEYTCTIDRNKIKVVELAFYGGSFTGIPKKIQSDYLSLALSYKEKGIIDKIHMSTRPDYISDEIIKFLLEYKVDVIELGAQSFSDKVLTKSKRGHSAHDIDNAAKIIKNAGIELGIQLMVGLPGDDRDTAIASAKKAAMLKPDLARIYPTIVFPDTELEEMLKCGEYEPLKEAEAISVSKEIYKILFNAGIKIMRVGLKSTDLVNKETELGGDYHPAFRQLVEGEIVLDSIMEIINRNTQMPCGPITVVSNSKTTSAAVGHKGCNKIKLESMGFSPVKFKQDESLKDLQVRLEDLRSIEK